MKRGLLQGIDFCEIFRWYGVVLSLCLLVRLFNEDGKRPRLGTGGGPAPVPGTMFSSNGEVPYNHHYRGLGIYGLP
jgi:hypothetical protein